ncbi:DUF5713 family protein [Kitasatospora sp. NPDC088134]|uniref:DUF5713 family protein n=1 Tax=Kitasatospora sp. NPDC088134 TaxID=3364071 RepID=UPI00382174F6
MAVTNERMAQYAFLHAMVGDGYFPAHLVERGCGILRALCEQIEAERPRTLDELYVLTHAATERFNALDAELQDADSEIETVAREQIGTDFRAIAAAYGFPDADSEQLIAPRDW